MKKKYTTDGKVVHLSSESDINEKLSKILGKRFIEYRKKWDLANNLSLITEFPLFLHIELNQTCNYRCPHCIIGNPDEVHTTSSRHGIGEQWIYVRDQDKKIYYQFEYGKLTYINK